MSTLADCHEPGILLVLAQPTAQKFLQDFHDWYDHEHGPARLRLGKSFFVSGYRYRTADQEPIWLAIYDMMNLSAGTDPTYTTLRENRSLREQNVFQHKLKVLSRQFLRLEASSGVTAEPSAAICCIQFQVDRTSASDVGNWYRKTLFAIFQRDVNCSRSRLFELVDGTGMDNSRAYFLAIHDLTNSLESTTHPALALAKHTLSQSSAVLPGASLQMFVFHRQFSAEDYICPDSTSTRAEPSTTSNENGHDEKSKL